MASQFAEPRPALLQPEKADSKYSPLRTYLQSQDGPVTLGFDEIEKIIGSGLPPSAFVHMAWWANTLTHIQAHAWLDAGFETEDTDLAGRAVTFRPKKAVRKGRGRVPAGAPARHPLFGALKGKLRAEPDVDLTEPADPHWGARDADLPR